MHDPLPPPSPALLTLITPLANTLNLTTLPNHIHEIIYAYLFYTFVHIFAAPFLSQHFTPKTYSKLSRRTKIDWDIRIVSEVQSILISCFAFFLLASDEQRRGADWRERLWGYNGATGLLQACVAGYFLWDVQVCILHFDVEGVGSFVHAIGALAVTCLGFRPFANYYGLNFILYELSTPFLNIHWFLDEFGMNGSRAQWINGILLMATFACSRLIWGTYQSVLIYLDLWTAWNNNHLVGDRQGVSLAKSVGAGGLDVEFPLWLALLYVASNTALSCLNFYWFGRMIQAVREKSGAAKEVDGTAGEKKEN